MVVLVIGEHRSRLTDIVSYNLYERMLGLSQTPWSQRRLEGGRKGKKAGTEARAKAGAVLRAPNTKPSHPLGAYAGQYEHPAYGIVKDEPRPEKGQTPVLTSTKSACPLSSFPL